jgi:hypothetical protein
MRDGERTTLRAAALCLIISLPSEASELPGTVRSGEVEIRIVSSSPPIILRQSCTEGPYTKTLMVKGTGEAQLRLQIRGQPPCPPEVTDFEVSAGDYLEMLNGLLAIRFHRLDREYSGREQYIVHGPGTLQRVISVCSDCADDVTVSLEMGEYQHTVHWGDGAEVPGLREWVSRWRAELEAQARRVATASPD